MRIYPPYSKTRVRIANPEAFRNYLTQKIRQYGKGYDDDVLVGKINGDTFISEVERSYYNTARPIIKGKIKDGHLTISIGIRDVALIIPLGFILIFLIMGIIKMKLIAIPLAIFVSLFLYLLFWILFAIEIKSTKRHVEEVIDKAKGKPKDELASTTQL